MLVKEYAAIFFNNYFKFYQFYISLCIFKPNFVVLNSLGVCMGFKLTVLCFIGLNCTVFFMTKSGAGASKSMRCVSQENGSASKNKLNYSLLEAARSGSVSEINRLLKAGAEINGACGYRGFAIHYAAGNDFVDALEILLDEGANIDAVNSKGDTALLTAASNGRSDAIRFLLAVGANVNAVNNKGETALSIAAYEHHVCIVKLLLDGGAVIPDRLDFKPAYSPVDEIKRIVEQENQKRSSQESEVSGTV